MTRQKQIIMMLLFFLFPVQIFALLPPGTKAPGFTVSSGDEKVLTLKSVKGKVVVGFYEYKDVQKNSALKDELNRFRAREPKDSPGTSFRLAVTDASSANLMTRWIWRKKIKSKSRELGMTLYGDWTGEMRRDYGFVENESNFIIIDKKGFIRYTRAGEIPKSEYPRIKELIAKLSAEK